MARTFGAWLPVLAILAPVAAFATPIADESAIIRQAATIDSNGTFLDELRCHAVAKTFLVYQFNADMDREFRALGERLVTQAVNDGVNDPGVKKIISLDNKLTMLYTKIDYSGDLGSNTLTRCNRLGIITVPPY
jgi:hypothetical protein